MMLSVLWLLLGAVQVAVAQLAPLHPPENADSVVRNEYIVGLADNCTIDAHWDSIQLSAGANVSMLTRFNFINAYHALMDEDTLHKLVRADPAVKYVEHNVFLPHNSWPTQDSQNNFTDPSLREEMREDVTNGSEPLRRWQQGYDEHVNWAVRMVNAGTKLDLSLYRGPADFILNAGLGVNVYVIDTGVRTTHSVFNKPQYRGRAVNFQFATDSKYVKNGPTTMDDLNGHGTAVAGAVAMHATGATIVNVKVYNDDDDDYKDLSATGAASVLNAFNDILNEHWSFRVKKPYDYWKGSVINLSMKVPGSNSDSWLNTLRSAYNAGIPVAVSSGNQGQVPAPMTICGLAYVICVAAAGRDYAWGTFSNYGSKVPIIAPGVDVPLAGIANNQHYWMGSGTSFAAPVVAAVMANIVSLEAESIENSKTVFERLYQNALYGVISNVRGADTPNRFVQTGLNNKQKDPRLPYLGAPASQANPQ